MKLSAVLRENQNSFTIGSPTFFLRRAKSADTRFGVAGRNFLEENEEAMKLSYDKSSKPGGPVRLGLG